MPTNEANAKTQPLTVDAEVSNCSPWFKFLHVFLRWELLPQGNQMQLSKKQKDSSLFFAGILKSTSNFEYFEKKDEPRSWCFSEIRDCHCMKKRIFLLQKFVKRTEKIIFLLVFLCFRFTEISYFLGFPSNENVR